MTDSSSHGASSRTPVIHGGRRVPGLHQRTLKDGTVTFEARLRIDGKDTRVVLEATTKSDAVREHAGLRVDRDRDDIHENRLVNPTVGDVCEELLTHLRTRVDSPDERFRVAPATIRIYEAVVRRYLGPALGRKRIANVDVVDLRRFVDTLRSRGLAPRTGGQALEITSRLFAFAVKQGYVDRNIVRDLDRDERPGSKRVTEPRYLTEEEGQRLLDAAELHYRPLLACCLYAGLRSGEARGLRWEDIDFDEGGIRITHQIDFRGELAPLKTADSHAVVPMLPALRRELVEHRQREGAMNIASIQPSRFVFAKTARQLRNRGATYTARDLYGAVRLAGDTAGLNPPGLPPVGVHDLRHSFVALALQHGATLPEAAELARHSNPQTTLRMYAGLTEDGRGRAARKLLDAGFGT